MGTEEWTVVLARSGRKKRGFQKMIIPPKMLEPAKPWAPENSENDPERELKLMGKMHTYVESLQSSQFYQAFMDQIQRSEMSDLIGKVLVSEEKMSMVVYGIGSIESYEPPRLQLGLAILMKKNLSWIGDVEVFDPVISSVESKVLSAFGFSVLSINEEGQRQASKPTFFFMPHCEAVLYNNLLRANWEVNRLNQIVLLGNSFNGYEQVVSTSMLSVREETHGHIFAVRSFTKEFPVNTVSDDYFRAFHTSSWHFFNVESDADLQLLKL
ncbi:OLC1v1033185C1 [Oldenlandia corymbosa var. corymbosa]|uniref:OLC1v1033185C1 n=1 Tax=Oldenlandia corymbosa var. corymbosa TaxID=529605 RepID=A0AAV1CNB3_OLDCO|nr:OLC1v1033185C1 [Oldenlandia corymbosa var. corymbosa]